MELPRNRCPYCDEAITTTAVACPKCGHVFYNHSFIKKDEEGFDPKITKEDIAYLAFKPKEFDANVKKIIRPIIALLVFGALLAGEFIIQNLLKELVALNEKPINYLIYVYLGVLLVLPFLFFITVSLSKNSISNIKNLEHQDGFSLAGKILSIVALILGIAGVIFGLFLIVNDLIQVIPIIIQSFQS